MFRQHGDLPQYIRVTLPTRLIILAMQLSALAQVIFGIILMLFVSTEYDWLRLYGLITTFGNAVVIALDIPKLILVLAMRDYGNDFNDDANSTVKDYRYCIRVTHQYQIHILKQ